MRMNGMHVTNTDLINKYLYNGKELQDQTNFYDYGYRQMDPQLGRWHVIDALSEKYYSHSPYAYTKNDPINHVDVMGLASMSVPYLHIGSTHAGSADLWGFFHNYDFAGTFDNAGGSSSGGGYASGHWEDVDKTWEIVTDWFVNGKYVDTRTTYEVRPGKEWAWDHIDLGGKAAQDFYRAFIGGKGNTIVNAFIHTGWDQSEISRVVAALSGLTIAIRVNTVEQFFDGLEYVSTQFGEINNIIYRGHGSEAWLNLGEEYATTEFNEIFKELMDQGSIKMANDATFYILGCNNWKYAENFTKNTGITSWGADGGVGADFYRNGAGSYNTDYGNYFYRYNAYTVNGSIYYGVNSTRFGNTINIPFLILNP